MPALELPDGRRLAYGEAGQGPTLVLVHGSPADGRAWSRVGRPLAGRYRVLTPDLPGYGGSDPLPPGADHLRGMTAAVAALLAAQPAPVLLAAHSFGGVVALHAALAQPERVRAALLLEPVLMRALALGRADAMLAETQAFFAAYTGRIAAGEHGAVRLMVDFWFGPDAFATLPPPVRAYLEQAAPANAADVRSVFADDLPAAALAAFDRPVLVAHGGASPPVAPAIAAALAALLPRGECLSIPGAGHGMLDSHPEAVAALIDRLAAL